MGLNIFQVFQVANVMIGILVSIGGNVTVSANLFVDKSNRIRIRFRQNKQKFSITMNHDGKSYKITFQNYPMAS